MSSDIILYGTENCHLCELATAYVIPVAKTMGLTFTEIDIAGNKQLESLYDVLIPVLLYRGQMLLWPFDDSKVYAFLALGQGRYSVSS